MKGWRISRLLPALAVILGVCIIGIFPSTAHADSPLSTIYGLHVSGNHLLNSNGETVRLLGVNRSGTEYKCVNNAGIFDGPNDQASIDAMKSWHINAVRIPLNEDCWLWVNAQNQYTGSAYVQAIEDYVNLLDSNGIIPILDLHWTAPGSTLAVGQQPMPDVDHSEDFWWSVASTFSNNSSVIFNLFNEPHATSGGACWENGSSAPNTDPCSDVNFAVAGMQTLVSKVRQAGANNVIMLDGWGYANYIGEVLNYLPSDPDNNLMISAHVYDNSGCNTTDCYNQQYNPVASQLPLVLGEIGESDCAHGFIDNIMNWADQNGVSYMGWAWDTYDCGTFPSLISNYDGTPTAFGIGLRDHLASLFP